MKDGKLGDLDALVAAIIMQLQAWWRSWEILEVWAGSWELVVGAGRQADNYIKLLPKQPAA